MSKVFIFDPTCDTQESIIEVLELEGHEVYGSSDATIAFKRIMAWIEKDGKGPDIILVEYFPSRKDPQHRGGDWLASELKRCSLTDNIPLIIMCDRGSRKSTSELHRYFREHHEAVAYLAKPFTLKMLKGAINGLLWVYKASAS